MSWEDTTPAQGTPATGLANGEGVADSPAAAVETTTDPPSPALADASGAQPAETAQGAEVPFHQHPRWIEIQQQKREAEERASQLLPWQPVIERLTAEGLSPQEIAEYLENPPPPATPPIPEPDPDAEFEAHLDSLGDTRWDLTERELRMERVLFDIQREQQAVQRRHEEWQTEREQAEQQQRVERFQAEYQTVAAQEPVFQHPILRDVAGLVFEKFGSQHTAAQIAELLKQPVQAEVQRVLAEYQQGKKADAEVPVTVGGGAVDPHPNRQSIHALDSEADKIAQMTSYLEARHAAGR